MYVKRELILISEDVMLEAKDDNLENSSDKIIEKAEQSLYQLAKKDPFSILH